MADEDNAIEGGDAAPAVESTPALKKQRAPRRAKAASQADVSAAPAEGKSAVAERKKRGVKAGQSPAANDTKPRKAKAPRGNAAAKSLKAVVASAPVSAAEEMAELLQLEEENKRLRRTLAEKLRTENADLRKRLGLT